MDNTFKLLAVTEVQKSYHKNIDTGTTEYALSTKVHNGVTWQFLAIPGTNEWKDWLLNFLLWSKKGTKICAYWEADKVYKLTKNSIDHSLPLCVVGHSKGGQSALQYMLKYGANRCLSICVPPTFRPWKVPIFDYRTLLILDPDDIVPKAGIMNFKHPIANIEYLPSDKKWYDLIPRISEHFIDHIVEYYKHKVKQEASYGSRNCLCI